MEKIIERILKLMRKKNVSLRMLSESIGMSATGLSKTLKDHSLKVSILLRIADYFGVPVNYFFEDIYLNPVEMQEKRSIVIDLLEKNVINVSIKPIIRDVIKNDFSTEHIRRTFGIDVSFNALLIDAHGEKGTMEDLTKIEFAIYDEVIKRDIVKDLYKLRYLSLFQVVNEIKECLDDIHFDIFEQNV
jgi:transcriptional regulator with XRE-family HTH domain